jgi:hypothetical protein
MTISSVLTLIVGLMLVYALLGVLASTLQELVTGVLGVRAKSLEARLRSLLADANSKSALPTNNLQRFWQVILWGKTKPGADSVLLRKIMESGIIKSASAEAKPSYVKTDLFVQSVVAALHSMPLGGGEKASVIEMVSAALADPTGNGLPDGNAKNALTAFLQQSDKDLDAFKKSVAAWFDESMDRLNGVYTRWSKLFALLFGLIAAIAFNIDTLTLAKVFYNSTAEQQKVIRDTAEDALKTRTGGTMSQQTALELLQAIEVPVTWPDKTYFISIDNPDTKTFVSINWPNGWYSLLGWIVTAIAVSFGASFWFDALGKVLDLRMAGTKPAPSSDTPTKQH